MTLPFAGTNIASLFPGLNLGGAPAQNTSQAPPMPAFPAIPSQANFGGAEALNQQVLLIQLLMQQGIPQDQWAPIIQALSSGAANAGAVQAGFQNFWNSNGRNDGQLRDGSMRSPPPAGRYPNRDRSRSPQGWGRERGQSPPRRRDSPTYGDYDGDSAGRGDPYDRRGRGRGGRGRDNDYRQRSPPGNRRGRSPDTPDRYTLPPGGPKWVDYDPTVGKDSIKGMKVTHGSDMTG